MVRHTEQVDSISSGRRPDDGVRFSEKAIFLASAVALLLGVAVYNVIPIGSAADDAPTPASLSSPADEASDPEATPATVALVEDVLNGGRSAGSSFGSAVDALQDGATAEDLVGTGQGSSTVDDSPVDTTPVPAPECPTAAASDAYDSVAGPVSDATGQPLPQDNLRVLAEIAAGCSAESPTTPLIGLALDLARLVPPTGLDPVDLQAIPSIDAPLLPQPVIDALEPLAEPIGEACGTVGLLGVLLAVLPGAANVPVHGQDLADAIRPAQSLCAQFEG
jgi:hypothetical protein